MDKAKWPALIGLCCGTLYLYRILPSTFALEKPLASATVCLITVGFGLIALGKYLRNRGGRLNQDVEYDLSPWNLRQDFRALRASHSLSRHLLHQPGARTLRLSVFLLVTLISLRIQLLLRILGDVQCATATLEPLIPLPFAFLDYFRNRPKPDHQSRNGSLATSEDALDHHRLLRQTLWRRCLCVSITSSATVATLALCGAPASTFVCSSLLNAEWLTPVFQLAGTAVDVCIIYLIAHLLTSDETQLVKSAASRSEILGKSLSGAAFISAIILLIESAVFYLFFAKPAERIHMLAFSGAYISSTVQLNLALLFTTLCFILCVPHTDVVTATMIPTFAVLCAAALPITWSPGLAFFSTHTTAVVSFFAVATLGFGAYYHFDTICYDRSRGTTPLFRSRPTLLYLGLLIILLAQLAALTTGHSRPPGSHPIDQLIQQAQVAQEAFVAQASNSKTLSEAVGNYRKRYGRAPPPGFDQWHAYATAQNSIMIDDFDSIERDIFPFRAFQPKEIRDRTWDMISNPWHEVSGILIRNGTLSIAPNVMPTHRWMLEGVVSMIRPFAQFLPDMDLALNVNDEPRIAVPHETARVLQRKALRSPPSGKLADNSFSADRAEQWTPVSETANQERYMIMASGRNIFHEFGSVACPPQTAARSQRLWDVSRLCGNCITPHSEELFLSNWTKAGDVCHQPDLADLHGLYISPAAFKPTHDLFPVFSQSKAPGFSDILYPSAWNYIGKTKYKPSEELPDVSFTNKNHTIYWRGGTTEGISHDFGHWKGMARQRFVRLANDAHHQSPPESIMVPLTDQPSSPYKYTSLSISTLKSLLATDISFVNQINRCDGLDCVQQEHEFGPLAPRAPFDQNWQYKYLLDVDGAGFSGRFLPFLQSHSLPFKAALYREWWDDRVRAWYHFVPLDLRGHGFWATLAFFAGLQGKVDGRMVKMEARDSAAERLAENGRLWAQKALRREDMEIYMFRLLLEWGRLTDDRREEIGFEMEAG